MSTQQTFTAKHDGPVFADLTSHTGTVTVTVDPTLIHAQVTVSTPDDQGPAADAVRNTTFGEYTSGEHAIALDVPRTSGGSNGAVQSVVSIGGSCFEFNSGVVNTGTITGAVISNGDVWVGGQQVVAGGRVVAQAGTVVSGGTGRVTLDVRVPANSSVYLKTTSADLNVRGDLQRLSVKSVSGDIQATGVHTIAVTTTSGAVEIERIETHADIVTVSGRIEVGAYNGSQLHARTVSGDIRISATPAATPASTLTAETVSGDITLRGTDRLNPHTRTISRSVSQH